MRPPGWFRAWSGLLLPAMVACSPASGRLVDVRIATSQPPLLSIASHWTLPGPTQEVQRDGLDYAARIPIGRFPVPFVDLNGNGRLDLDDEPVGRCEKNGGWRCVVEPARLTLHRVQRQDVDATFAIAEVFSPGSLRKDEKARLCLSDVGRCTDGPMGAPYLNSGTALTLPVCDLANVDAPGKLHDIELRSGKEIVLKARLGQPPPMSLKTKLTREREGFRVSGSGALPIHRVVVWSARYEQNQPAILWTSEARPDLMTRREREFEYLIPREVVIGCASCVIGVQAVSQVASGPISVSSEGSAVLPPKELL
jgi:hypothetical protein